MTLWIVIFDLYTTEQHFSLARSFLCQSIREFKMATQVTGRKRIPNREKLSAEDDALSQIAREVRQMISISRAAGRSSIVLRKMSSFYKYWSSSNLGGLDELWKGFCRLCCAVLIPRFPHAVRKNEHGYDDACPLIMWMGNIAPLPSPPNY